VGERKPSATVTLLDALRHATPEESSKQAAKLLNEGVSPDSLWDSVALAGSEWLLRKPGIIALHAMTSANALHFIYGASGDTTTRKLALLQAAAWAAMFRDANGKTKDLHLDAMEPIRAEGSHASSVAEVFASMKSGRDHAAATALGYFASGGSPDEFFALGRRLVFHKGTDSHDYKYAAAAWEEAMLASDPKWRAPLCAAALAYLPSPETPDSPLMIRAREAVAGLA
jgi:hypothetical protein